MNLNEMEGSKLTEARIGSEISDIEFKDYQYIDDLNDLELLQSKSINTKPVSPSYIVNSTYCKNIHEEIKDISHGLEEILPRVITSPYTFLDVKILRDEYHAAAVTSAGSFIYLNLYNNHFLELSLGTLPLSVVIVYKNDSIAIVKSQDYPIIFKIDVPKMKVVQQKKYEVNGIGKLALSPSENFIFARVWEGKILKIDLKDLEKYSEVFKDPTMISMNVSSDSFIYVGTSDKRVLKLDENGKLMQSKKFKFRIDAYIYFSNNGELVLLALPDSIIVLKSDDLEIINSIFTGVQSYALQLTIDENYVLAGLDTGELGFFSRYSNNSVKIRIHQSSITSVFTTRDTLIIYTFSTDSRLAVIYFPKLSIFKKTIEINFPLNAILMATKEFEGNQTEEIFKPLCMALSDRKDIVIVGGESYSIAVWDRSTMRKNGELMGHLGFVYSLACLSDSVVASGGADSKVILWHFRNLRKIATLQGHFSAVSAVVKIDNLRLASGSWDKTVQIWLWELQEKLFTIKNLPDRIVALCTPKYNKLLIGMTGFIYCWDLLTYSVMFEKESESEISCFRVLESSSEHFSSIYIGLGMDEDALWFEDPFLSKNLEVWGSNETGTYEFYYYLQGIIKKETVKYNEEMNKYTIFPYKLNALHFYAYFNMPEYLYKALANGAALLNSSSGANPLSISIELGYKDCTQSIISAAWDKRQTNPHILSIISVTTLNELHLNSTPNMSKVYKMLMITSISSIRQDTNLNLPYIKTSESQYSFKKMKTGKIIEKMNVRKSVISLYIHPGSEKSIKFLYSLSICEDYRVLRTEFIQNFLLVKWKAVRFFVFFEFFLFFCHFLTLVAYCSQIQLWGFKVGALILGFLLFGLEFITTVRAKSYLGALCIVQGLLLVVWVILEKDSQEFNSLLIVFSALYGINYFQIFERSFQTLQYFQGFVKRIPGFLPPFMYFVVFCYGIYYKFLDFFEDSLNFQEDFNDFSKILKFSAVFVVVLGFSGVLIDRENTNVNKSCFLLKIILKYELIMLWNRGKDSKVYMQVFDKVNSQRNVGLKKVKSTLKSLNKQINEGSKELREELPEIKFSIQNIESSLKRVKREFQRKSEKKPQKTLS